MAKITPFIGREFELTQIDSWINEKGTYRVICVTGEGGIGKTRLLQEIHRLYNQKKKDLIVTRILDFDDRILHSATSLGFTMSQALVQENQKLED